MTCMLVPESKRVYLSVPCLFCRRLPRRRRARPVSASGRTSRTLCACGAGGRPTTFRRSVVPAVPTLPPREESVSGNEKLARVAILWHACAPFLPVQITGVSRLNVGTPQAQGE